MFIETSFSREGGIRMWFAVSSHLLPLLAFYLTSSVYVQYRGTIPITLCVEISDAYFAILKSFGHIVYS